MKENQLLETECAVNENQLLVTIVVVKKANEKAPICI